MRGKITYREKKQNFVFYSLIKINSGSLNNFTLLNILLLMPDRAYGTYISLGKFKKLTTKCKRAL
jgi:hypothetical protein